MKVLKVQGEGHVFAEPDIVTLTFEVEVESTDYARCVGDLNERTDNLRESIVASGLNIKSLKTSSFNVRSINKHLDDNWVFWGYSASHTMSILLPLEKSLLNSVLNNIVEGHSNAEISLKFSFEDQDSLRKRALAKAVHEGRTNAETLASAAGVILGDLQQIDYGWNEVRIHETTASYLCEEQSGVRYFEADIEAEDVRATDKVTLVYELME